MVCFSFSQLLLDEGLKFHPAMNVTAPSVLEVSAVEQFHRHSSRLLRGLNCLISQIIYLGEQTGVDLSRMLRNENLSRDHGDKCNSSKPKLGSKNSTRLFRIRCVKCVQDMNNRVQPLAQEWPLVEGMVVSNALIRSQWMLCQTFLSKCFSWVTATTKYSNILSGSVCAFFGGGSKVLRTSFKCFETKISGCGLLPPLEIEHPLASHYSLF